jgi:branched-chain amino acid aminotransferase
MNTELMTAVAVKRTNHPRLGEVDFDRLAFGQHTSDHMLLVDYKNNQWQNAAVVPYADITVSPATAALHYGQTVFEGMKAYRMRDGRISIFRVKKHYKRFAESLYRMCMAVPSEELFTEGLKELIKTDSGWVPRGKGASLYIRPFIFATDAKLGVKISEQYRFIIFTGPVPPLYATPLKVKVETTFIRAARGGTGAAKCGGNYGGAYYPTKLAQQEGYDQVLWTDARDHRFIEESGTMNVMFVIGNKLITPALSDSILDGVTRDSLLVLARHLGYETQEKPVSLDELEEAFRKKTITEAFGAGTAAVVAPIQTIHINGIDFELPAYSASSLLNRLKQLLENIRTGVEEDVYGWNFTVG